MKVLVVDDSGTMRSIQKRSLVKLGVAEQDISEAANGQVGLDTFKGYQFDLILTDWNMPGMDGLTFVKEVRKADKDIPILMVTTESERERVVTAIQAGVSDYLLKPFTHEELGEKLKRWAPSLK